LKINSEATLPDIVYATHPYRWVVLAGVWLAYACFGMTVASLAPLMQPITRDLAISDSAMGAVPPRGHQGRVSGASAPMRPRAAQSGRMLASRTTLP